MFGSINKSDKVINWLFLTVKQYIYRTKYQSKRPNIFAVQHIIKEQFEIQKYILMKNCKYNEFFTMWSNWQNLFGV